MNCLIVFALFISTSVFAAKVSSIDRATNKKIEVLKTDFAQLDGGSYTSDVQAYKIHSRGDTETIENIIKQLVYISRSKVEYAHPDSVTVQKIKKDEEQAVFSSIVELLSFETFLREKANNHFDLVKPTKQLVYFESSDSNSFGYCRDLVIFDIKNQEVIFLGACYAE